MKCCLVVGHSATGDQGAVNSSSKITEWNYNYFLAPIIHDIVKQYDPSIDIAIVHREPEGYINLPTKVNILSPDFIIELHCNGVASKKVYGCEMRYWKGSKLGKSMAEILVKEVHSVLENRNRGAIPKSGTDRGAYFLKRTVAPTVIAEPFFLTNDWDTKNAMRKFSEVAKAYAQSIIMISKMIKKETL